MTDPTLTVSAADHATAAALVRQLLLERNPDLDLTSGSGIDGLVVQNQAYVGAYLLARQSALLALSSLRTMASMGATSADIDVKAADYGVTRRAAVPASGQLRLVFLGNLPVTLSTSFEFTTTSGGTTTSFVPATNTQISPAGAINAPNSLPTVYLSLRQDGLYETVLDVVAVSATQVLVSQGQQFTATVPLGGLQVAEAVAAFTTGSAAETDAEVIARCRLGITPAVVLGPDNIRSAVSDAFAAGQIGVVGAGHSMMTRDTLNLLGIPTGGKVDVYAQPLEVLSDVKTPYTSFVGQESRSFDAVQYAFDTTSTPALKPRVITTQTPQTFATGTITNVATSRVELQLKAGKAVGALRIKQIRRYPRIISSAAVTGSIASGYSVGQVYPISGVAATAGYHVLVENGVKSALDVTSAAALVYDMAGVTSAMDSRDYYGALVGNRKIVVTDTATDVLSALSFSDFSLQGDLSYTYRYKIAESAGPVVLNATYLYGDIVLVGYGSTMDVGQDNVDTLVSIRASSAVGAGHDVLVKVVTPCEVGVSIVIKGQDESTSYASGTNAPLAWLSAVAGAINSTPVGSADLGFDPVVRALSPFLTTGVVSSVTLTGTLRGSGGDITLTPGAKLTIPVIAGNKISPDTVGFVSGIDLIKVYFQ